MRAMNAQATPRGTRMMCTARVNAICERAQGTGSTASTWTSPALIAVIVLPLPVAHQTSGDERSLTPGLRVGEDVRRGDVVELVLVGVGRREVGDRCVERVAGAEIRGERDAVPRTGVTPR